jgi:fatty acid desaturase
VTRPRLYRASVAPRTRALAFGSAALLVVAGGVSAGLIGGLTGQVLAIALITVGLGGALLLLFLEVGMSEDRERAKEEERRRRRARRVAPSRRPRLPRRPRRPG